MAASAFPALRPSLHDMQAGALQQKASWEDAGAGLADAVGAFDTRDKLLADASATRAGSGAVDSNLLDSHSPVDALQRYWHGLMQASPQLGATLGAAGLGFMGGEAAFPAGGGIPGAILAAGAVNYPGHFGQNIRAQVAAQQPSTRTGPNLAPGRAAAAAIPQSALDSLLTVLMPGGLAKPIAGGVLTRSAQGAIEQAVMNAPAGALQEAMTIFQANPSLGALFTPDSQKRIGSAFVNAGLTAAPIGALGRGMQGEARTVGTATAADPVLVRNGDDLEVARARTDLAPTDLMKATGRYQKGFINLDGLDVAIENPQGSIRSGIGANGEQWNSVSPADYGYVPRTHGADGDPVDVYLGPHLKSKSVFVVDQIDPATGLFDEHKAMVGYPDVNSAMAAYDAAFSDGSAMSRVGGVRKMPFDTFKTWAKDGDTENPVGPQTLPKTPSDIHRLADALGVKSDDDPIFAQTSKQLTGKEHLDDMNTSQLQRLYDALNTFGRSETSPEFSGDLPATVDPNANLPKDPFYSQLQRFVENAKQPKATPEQWLGMMRAAPGIREDELDWSGVKDFLGSQKGAVTKQQLLDHINENGVKVNEIIKDNRESPRNEPEGEEHRYEEGSWETEEPDTDYLSDSAYERLKEDLNDKLDDPLELEEMAGQADDPHSHLNKSIEEVFDKHLYNVDPNDLDPKNVRAFLGTAVDNKWIYPQEADRISSELDRGTVHAGDWNKISDAVRKHAQDTFNIEQPEPSEHQGNLVGPGSAHRGPTDTEDYLAPYEEAIAQLHGEYPDLKGGIEEDLKDRLHDDYYERELEWYNEDPDSPQQRTDTVWVDGEPHEYSIRNSYGEWSVYDKHGRDEIDLPRGRLDEARMRQAIEQHAAENYGYGGDGYDPNEDRDEEDIEPEQIPNSRALYGGKPKWESYKLHGGTNYREMLLTLPKPEETPEYQRLNAEGAELRMGGAKLGQVLPNGQTVQQRLDDIYAQQQAIKDQTYQSGHWNEPNVLAHIRMNDRVGPNGEKILNLEEIQSDWHQEGRERGYRSISKPTAAPELGSEDMKVTENRDDYTVTAPDGRSMNVGKGTVSGPGTAAGYGANYFNLKSSEDYKNAYNDWAAKIPDAPFKKSWQELAFKRALREAAEGGYDKMTWTTGDQQNERWSSALRQQVQRVSWGKLAPEDLRDTQLPKGTVNVQAKGPSGTVAMNVRPDGIIGQSRYSELEGRHLSEVLGQDAAQKILAQPMGSLESEDIGIGLGGMRGFYDKMLPDFAKKIAKKYGSKVGMTRIKTTDMPWSEYSGYDVGHPYLEKDAPLVHSIDITPQMRESLLQGQPLFTADRFASPQIQQSLAEDVASIVNQVTNGKARLKLNNVMLGGGEALQRSGGPYSTRLVAGRYWPLGSLIEVSLDPQFDPTKAAAHESWHWLKQNGVFTDRQLSALDNNRPALENMVKADGLDPSHMSDEEIEATAFARWWRLQKNGENPYGVTPALRNGFDKAIRFFQELKGRVGRYGPTAIAKATGNPESVFQAAARGRVATPPTIQRLGAPAYVPQQNQQQP